MNIIYRRAKPADIPAITQVYAAALNDLYARHGFADQVAQSIQPNPYYAFGLTEEPGNFWVAESNSNLVGIGLSWIRGSFWFLSQLFILPTYQERKIGGMLLEKTLAPEKRFHFTNRALITFPFNRVSTALYMRYGIYPREPIYRMVGNSAALQSSHERIVSLNHQELHPGATSIRQLCSIDGSVLGIPLDRHHEYFLKASGGKCYLFTREEHSEGYAYVWSNGHIGPLAVVSSESFKSIMATAIRLAAVHGGPDISVMIPGSNAQAVEVALSHKMKITIPFLLMSSHPFGNWDKYLCYSPALM